MGIGLLGASALTGICHTAGNFRRFGLYDSAPVEPIIYVRTEVFSTKTGLSIVAVTGLSSLRDELPEFISNVLQ
jgi:hypothetical protein